MTDAVNPASISSVLQQMRSLRVQAGLDVSQAIQQDLGAERARPAEFRQLFVKALDSVNDAQLNAGALSDGFVKGQHQDLVSVMVASQKASLSFQALNQVRNRVVSAYQDIMNMPI